MEAVYVQLELGRTRTFPLFRNYYITSFIYKLINHWKIEMR